MTGLPDERSTGSVIHPPVALTIAGSDAGGGAGVQADLATMTARGVHATSAVTALTAQNTTGVAGVEPVSPEFVDEQIRAVTGDFDVAAAKTGMLGDATLVREVAATLADCAFPVVVDPVVVAESGDRLLSPEGERAIHDSLLPEATLVTPNVPELAALTDSADDPPATVDAAVEMAEALREAGATAVLVTGGHADWDDEFDGFDAPHRFGDNGQSLDLLVTDAGVERFAHERVADAATHGSGCTLSAAIAAELARGAPLHVAVERGTDHVHRAIRHGRRLGAGTGPVNHAAPVQAAAGASAAITAVRETVRAFETMDVSALVPEVGINVAVATPAATTPEDVAGVEGRLTRVPGGVRATGGAAMGASSHVARFLLAVREYDRGVTAACNVVGSDAVVGAVERNWETVRVDRREEPVDAAGTMDWVGATACERRDGDPPVAVVDDGAHGKEPMCRLVAASAAELHDRVRTLNRAVDID